MRMVTPNAPRRLRGSNTLAGMGCAECGGTCGVGMAVGRSQQRGLGRLLTKRGFHGLGDMGEWEALAASLLSSFAGGNSGSSGQPAQPTQTSSSTNVVTPTIITSVSPQISPTFQQQYQPTNSAATAGTTQGGPDAAMAALGVGNSNYPAGYPIQQPYATSGATVAGSSGQIIAGVDNTTLAIVGIGLLLYMHKGKTDKAKAT